MAEFIPVDPFDIVIFGGTGDLSRRKLLPALYHRYLDGQIDDSSKIIGVARTELDRQAFNDLAKKACKAHTENFDEAAWERFSERLHYLTMDATNQDADWGALKSLLAKDTRPVVFYLATTPLIYVDLCQAMARAGLNTPNTRLVLEKPIGTDLASAQAINEGVGAVFEENKIYRIDHYLGKETVQNLLVLRFANTLFEPIWSRHTIDHVQITVSESIGLEGRADYYDRSGAVRDMVQNHILQLLCLTAMEPPNNLDGDEVRTEKIKVLKALQRFTPETAKTHTVRGQYAEGLVEGDPVTSYVDTLSKDNSDTETFVAIKTGLDNWRWAGVPFYLRTGKRMKERRSEIVIQFKPTPHALFKGADQAPNRLVIRLQPDEGMQLYMQVKEPGPGGLRLKSLPLNLSYADNFLVRYPDAYERLLMDVVRGNLALFMRRDEVEAAWSWVDNLLESWHDGNQPLESYAAGTSGPLQSAMLMDRDHREWWESKR
ncbi:glucose-6-phosphate dehydrogenase [Fretibacter rubidus]|uniref:glucose-6-phosphate dehydrogenase n=1 Tax=Fretibacter rubidus TaxID=570162 RepID=UPI00352B2FA6